MTAPLALLPSCLTLRALSTLFAARSSRPALWALLSCPTRSRFLVTLLTRLLALLSSFRSLVLLTLRVAPARLSPRSLVTLPFLGSPVRGIGIGPVGLRELTVDLIREVFNLSLGAT